MSTVTEAPVAAEPEPAAAPRPGWSAAARDGVLAVVDQAAVSGTNFLTVVLVGRACGQEELGYYSLAVTILVLLATLQDAFVVAPYTVFRARLRGRRGDEYAGRVLVQQGVLGLVAGVGMGVAAALAGGIVGNVPWVVAAVVPVVLLREFCRRVWIVHGRILGLLALDLAIAVVQLAALVWVASEGWLTASVALAVVGLVCGVTAVAALALARGDFPLRRRRVGREVGRHWAFGRWIAAGQMVGVAHGYTVHWLLGLVAGPAATGAFAACLAVVLLSNPFYLAMGSLLGPRVARARVSGGPAAVRRAVGRTAFLLVAVMGAYCGVLAVAGDRAMHLLYGADFEGYGVALTLLAAACAVNSVGMAADHGLRALGHPRVAFTGSVIGLAITTTTLLLLVERWGITGAAVGYLLGSTASAAARAVSFLRLSAAGIGGGCR